MHVDELRRAAVRLLLAMFVVDAALIAVNLHGAPAFFDLDEERNFPTWYSSAKLLLACGVALGCSRLDPAELRSGLKGWIWRAVAVIFVLLSMDETSTAHERLAAFIMAGAEGSALRQRVLGGDSAKDAFIWPILFAPVIVAMLYLLAAGVYDRMKSNRTSLVLGLAGCGAFLAAILLEGPAVYLSPPIDAWSAGEVSRYSFLVLVEESMEILGTSLMLAALLLHLARLFAARSLSSNLAGGAR